MKNGQGSIEGLAMLDRRAVIAGLAAAGMTASCATTPEEMQLTPAQRMARAISAPGKGTIYDDDTPPPVADVWPTGIRADCSGFVAWVHGLARTPPKYADLDENAQTLFTDTIYDDMIQRGRQFYFRRQPRPTVGGIVLYPLWWNGTRNTMGHIGFITQVRSNTDYSVIDCSETVFNRTRDAISERSGSFFEDHRRSLVGLRAQWPNKLHLLQDPLFGRFID